MPKHPLNVCLWGVIFSGSLLLPNFASQPAVAQTNQYCQLSVTAAQKKEKLRLSAVKGNQSALKHYQKLIKQDAQELQECRQRTWPQTQAIWLRLYPCDVQRGMIDQIMDQIVNGGYNTVYLQVFYNGQVLLPSATNTTVWPSVVRIPGTENTDLLAQAISQGRERGLKVYAWMLTINFGYTYAQRPDREEAIARNGKGETSLYVVDDGSQVFIDPYNYQARNDYQRLVKQVLQRHPDGMLFDYVRYPRQSGANSIASKVTDLWLFTPATQAALFRRAQNHKAVELIRRFLSQGFITAADIEQVDKLYPQEGEPMWEGRIPTAQEKSMSTPQSEQPLLNVELWELAVAHAMQGVLDFVTLATYPVQQQGIPSGVVFFPEGNENLGRGYDSRLQPWDRFPSTLEWHPMAYASCGDVSCILAEVQRVLSMAKPGTQVIPALAGTWGKSVRNRPPLELQMQALQRFAPQIKGVSHFAYSWQHPEEDSDRKFCRNLGVAN